MNKIIPLKKFGQHYLTDKNILLKIASEIAPQKEDIVIEIGPGQGALTRELHKSGCRLTAVEIDRRVIENLAYEFIGIKIINADFLKIDLMKYFSPAEEKIRVVGNIPYNITSPILFKLIESKSIVKDAVFMIQLEVAQRFTGKQGSKDYGILSVILNFFCSVNLCFKVSPNVFYPKPKVFSAVVHLRFDKDTSAVKDEKLFIQTVKACFGNRRKTLKNSLNNSIFGEINFSECGIDLTKRAEQLSQDDFVILSNFIYSIKNDN